jgi:hypothetical protein
MSIARIVEISSTSDKLELPRHFAESKAPGSKNRRFRLKATR